MSDILSRLGLDATSPGAYAGGFFEPSGSELVSLNPATGEPVGTVRQAAPADYERVLASSTETFLAWRELPAPRRGEYVRQIGNAFRDAKADLGALVSLEVGKIRAEGEGEIQEVIDIADFAVGLSRQLYGLSMQSERPQHRMYEQWHPLGPVGVITAFNFPAAVWSWNAMIAAVCGDTIVWKPSSYTPLTSVAVQRICDEVMAGTGYEGVFNLVIGPGADVGELLLNDTRVPLVSATGSCRMGRRVAKAVGDRFGRALLELGGNNGIIVLDDADLDLATRAVLFGAVGTAGQRCTSTRRLIVQRGVAEELTDRLVDAYRQVKIGDPLESGTLMGPLVADSAVDDMLAALEEAQRQGGKVLCGGHSLAGAGFFVEPTIVAATPDMPIVAEETFAPILYVMTVDSLDEAIDVHNAVPQGLSSAIFTDSVRAAERFLSTTGSDCGIANVNIGTSGAEIGGAFGGEKETGGGREAGSDSWKTYMRRQTTTINWGDDLPLAQGITFGGAP